MPLHRYRYLTTWTVRADPRRVHEAVVDVESYPRWWPDVRSVAKVDDDTADLVCRSILPFVLLVRMERIVDDPDAGLVQVRLSGDLDGSLRAVVSSGEGATRLDIVQDVVARKPLLRRFALVARPVYRLNHAAMMRRGCAGLAAYLA